MVSGRRCTSMHGAIILAIGLLLSAGSGVHGQVTQSPTPSTSEPSPTAAPSSAATAGGDCVTDYDADAGFDYFPVKANIQYAETFSVEYSLSYKVLNATEGKDGNSTLYVLYQCGTTQPNLTELTIQEYIKIPVTKVATGTPDHIPRIEVRYVPYFFCSAGKPGTIFGAKHGGAFRC